MGGEGEGRRWERPANQIEWKTHDDSAIKKIYKILDALNHVGATIHDGKIFFIQKSPHAVT
jgi:hypothetical protein